MLLVKEPLFRNPNHKSPLTPQFQKLLGRVIARVYRGSVRKKMVKNSLTQTCLDDLYRNTSPVIGQNVHRKCISTSQKKLNAPKTNKNTTNCLVQTSESPTRVIRPQKYSFMNEKKHLTTRCNTDNNRSEFTALTERIAEFNKQLIARTINLDKTLYQTEPIKFTPQRQTKIEKRTIDMARTYRIQSLGTFSKMKLVQGKRRVNTFTKTHNKMRMDLQKCQTRQQQQISGWQTDHRQDIFD